MPTQNSLTPLLPRPPHVGVLAPASVPLKKNHRVAAACLNCRKQKIKCNGERPTCLQCQRVDLECAYELPEGVTSFQAKRKKISDLEKSNVDLHSVVGLLRHGREADSVLALRRIREAESVEEAINTLSVAQALIQAGPAGGVGSNSVEHPNRVEKTPSSRPSKRRITSPLQHPDYIFEKHYSYVRDNNVEEDIFVSFPVAQLDISPRWTSACSDNKLMNHLLTLFWTWDNSAEHLMYRPMIEEDLSSMDAIVDDRSKRRFCSPFLVNALLAISCMYTMDPATFSIPDDPTSRGRRFAIEADIMLERERAHWKPSVTLFQGLFAMFCFEGCLGSGQKSVNYLIQAIDVYKELNHPELLQVPIGAIDQSRLKREKHALSWSMWGFYVTEWRASQPLGFRKLVKKPVVERTWSEGDFPLLSPESSGFWWFPYPMSLKTQRSLKVEVREASVALAEIVEEALDFITPNEDSRPAVETPQRALELYDAIVRWKYSLPDRLRSEDAVLPNPIILNVAAELMLTAILRPFGQMSKKEFGRFNPRERCCSHASKMINEIWTYRANAILKIEYWLMHPATVSGLIVVQDLELGSAEVDTLIRACQCVDEMRTTYPLATDCLSTIHGAFKRTRLQTPDYVRKFFVETRHRKDGLMHHAIAALMPTGNDSSPNSRIDNTWSPSFQELLDMLEVTALD